jgi:hypothetical protein
MTQKREEARRCPICQDGRLGPRYAETQRPVRMPDGTVQLEPPSPGEPVLEAYVLEAVQLGPRFEPPRDYVDESPDSPRVGFIVGIRECSHCDYVGLFQLPSVTGDDAAPPVPSGP